MLSRLPYLILLLGCMGLLAAGCGGDDEQDPEPKANAATTEADDHGKDEERGGDEDQPRTPAEPATPAPRGATFEASVRGGAVQGGPRAFRATRGEPISITIASDIADEAHVHGIDADVAIPAGGEATLRFTPDAQGSYEVELHESGALVGTVIVR